MKSLALRGKIQNIKGYYVINPATKADATNLGLYVNATGDKYSTISFKSSTGSKSYSQVKTAWAIITMVFISVKGRKPTEEERKQTYKELLDLYSDDKLVVGILSNEEHTEKVTMSEMSERQLARFIQTCIVHLNQNSNNSLLMDDDIIHLEELFSEWKNYLSCLSVDPTDLNENGEYLSLDEYRATHPVSYASGRACGEDGSPLEMAHIVSKGSDPAFENCCWNVMMLTHEEHQGIMHGQEVVEGGWNALIERFPHIAGRVKRAYDMAHHLYKVMSAEGVEM